METFGVDLKGEANHFRGTEKIWDKLLRLTGNWEGQAFKKTNTKTPVSIFFGKKRWRGT